MHWPGVIRGQVRAGHLTVEHGLPKGFVFGVQERKGLPFVFSAQAGLPMGRCVFAVKDIGAGGGGTE
jgi:hypothetical protein